MILTPFQIIGRAFLGAAVLPDSMIAANRHNEYAMCRPIIIDINMCSPIHHVTALIKNLSGNKARMDRDKISPNNNRPGELHHSPIVPRFLLNTSPAVF
jgi:hypothetical protein